MARSVSSSVVFVLVTGLSSAAFAAGAGTLRDEPTRPSNVETVEHEQRTPTLLHKKTVIGGYAGLDVAYTRMFGEDGGVVGLQGALLFNRRLAIGLAGYAWTNPQSGPDSVLGEARSFQAAYFGPTLRYSFLPSSPVYFSVGGMVGGGTVALMIDDLDDDDRYDDRNGDDDAFAVFQPDVTVHANLTRWLRLGVTAGYRFTAGVDRYGYDESDTNGVVLGGQLQLGRF